MLIAARTISSVFCTTYLCWFLVRGVAGAVVALGDPVELPAVVRAAQQACHSTLQRSVSHPAATWSPGPGSARVTEWSQQQRSPAIQCRARPAGITLNTVRGLAWFVIASGPHSLAITSGMNVVLSWVQWNMQFCIAQPTSNFLACGHPSNPNFRSKYLR